MFQVQVLTASGSLFAVNHAVAFDAATQVARAIEANQAKEIAVFNLDNGERVLGAFWDSDGVPAVLSSVDFPSVRVALDRVQGACESAGNDPAFDLLK